VKGGDRLAFAQQMAILLSEVYERQVSVELADIYFTSLACYTVEDLAVAVYEHAQTSKFIPFPAGLSELCRRRRRERADRLAVGTLPAPEGPNEEHRAAARTALERIRAMVGKVAQAKNRALGRPVLVRTGCRRRSSPGTSCSSARCSSARCLSGRVPTAFRADRAMTRPAGLIDHWARRIRLEDLARLLFERHRDYERRVKVRDLGAALLGVVPRHGSAQEVALREAVSKLVEKCLPIGTEPGADGGVWWIASEDERRGVLVPLMGQVRALQRRIEAVQHAPLDFRLPTGQEQLL
jgi:hypothetical protein